MICKASWPVKSLGDVCEIRHGANQKAVEASDGLYPIYGSGGPIGFAKEYRCPAQTILIGRKGTLNKPILVQTPCWNIDTAYGLVPREIIASRFLFYFCLNTDFTTLDPSSGRPSTKATSIAKIPVPVPSLSEQKRIVRILDAAFEKIDTVQRNAERNLANAKELFQRILDEEMTPKRGWTSKKLGELGFFKNGLNYRQGEQGVMCPIVGVKDFSNTILSSAESLSTVNLASFPNDDYLLRRGDIVFVRSNGSKNLVGRSVLIDFDDYKASFSGFCIRYRIVETEINKRFFQMFIGRPSYIRQMLKDKDSCNINNANQTVLSSQIVSFPGIKEQERIFQRMQKMQVQCSQLELHYSKLVSQCVGLKQQILARAFNGEL